MLLSVLAITLLLAGGLLGLPRFQATPAHAARASSPTIVLTPTSAHYSPLYSSIFVQGTNYSANETVNIYWNYTGPGKGTLETTATADSTGAFLAQFVTPLAAMGSYIVAGVGQTSGLVATAPFQLLPHFGLNPYASGPGTTITFTGNAYGAGEVVKMYWNYTGPGKGTLLTSATSDATGSFTASAKVPAGATPGTTTPIAGVGQTTQAVAKGSYIFYPPTLAMAPSSGSPTTLISVSVYGLQGNEKASIYWNNHKQATGTADISGYIVFDVTVPSSTKPGSYPIKVIGSLSRVTATGTFTVVAPFSNLSLSSGPVGTKVKVSGQGYTSNEQVTIYWNYTGPNTGTAVATVNADYGGTVNATFAVPSSALGAYGVAAVGKLSLIVTQNTFTVANGLAASPSTRAPGTNATAAGTGYQAHETVQLYWDTTSSLPIATTTADAKGNINQTVTFPANATPGSHTLIGVGQSSRVSFSTPVTVDTPWGDFGFDFAHSRENTYENSVSTSNVANLRLRWSAGTAQGFKDSPVYANGIVYVATTDGKLDAYNATSGSLLWQFNTNTGFKNYSAPLLDPATGLIFFGLVGRDGSGVPTPFYALNAQSGSLVWSMIIPGNEFAFPTMGAQTLFMGISNEGATSAILSIDEMSGHINWQYNTSGGVWGAIGLDTSTHALFSIIGNPVDAVVSLNSKTGSQNWLHTLPSFGPDDDPGSGITVANGLVYVDDKNGSVYGLNESTGNQSWSTQIGSDFLGGDVSTQAVSANGNLYVGSLDNNLYALNATTGAVLWKTPTGGGIDSSPAVANGVVYFASFDHKFYALNATSGTVLWSYNTGSLAISSPTMVNGWLYCGSTNGKLYAFSL